ncbi:MAG: hypothetical protein GMKNLPBB_01892 [Myxococcota bacterium]|nr:hypothetical protein [Myxococcota bacterium]
MAGLVSPKIVLIAAAITLVIAFAVTKKKKPAAKSGDTLFPAACEDTKQAEQSCLMPLYSCFQPGGECSKLVEPMDIETTSWANGAVVEGQGGFNDNLGIGEDITAIMKDNVCYSSRAKFDLLANSAQLVITSGSQTWTIDIKMKGVEVACPDGKTEKWFNQDFARCSPLLKTNTRSCKVEDARFKANPSKTLSTTCNRIRDCICAQRDRDECIPYDLALRAARSDRTCQRIGKPYHCQ